MYHDALWMGLLFFFSLFFHYGSVFGSEEEKGKFWVIYYFLFVCLLWWLARKIGCREILLKITIIAYIEMFRGLPEFRSFDQVLGMDDLPSCGNRTLTSQPNVQAWPVTARDVISFKTAAVRQRIKEKGRE